jgi:hypothetical protein
MASSGIVVRIKGEDVSVRFTHEKLHDKIIISHLREVEFDRCPEDFPLIRELRIQNQKLLRMIYQEPEITACLESSVKKTRKKAGERAARIGRQFRKVNQLFDRACKELCREECRRAHLRMIKNAEFQALKIELNEYIAARAKGMKKQFIEMRLASDPSCLLESSSGS